MHRRPTQKQAQKGGLIRKRSQNLDWINMAQDGVTEGNESLSSIEVYIFWSIEQIPNIQRRRNNYAVRLLCSFF